MAKKTNQLEKMPSLTLLQISIICQLAKESQRTSDLKKFLESRGICQSDVAFYNVMARLVEKKLVLKENPRGRPFENTYRISKKGKQGILAVKKYLSLLLKRVAA